MINNALYRELIKKQDLESLEKHLIFNYLNNKNLDYLKSPILSVYFDDFDLNESLLLELDLLDIHGLKVLEKYLELLIPKRDRKLNGAFFTPDYIVNYIIEKIRPQFSHKNLDPSCGCGAFLTGLVEYYHRNYHKSIKETIKENIFGADILPYNVERAKLLLTIQALEKKEIVNESDFNIFCRDSLKYKWKGEFDNIVGNPPYVKFQDLTYHNRESLVNDWNTLKFGNFNLYFAFFELGLNLLSAEGKLGYITPNNYFTSLAAKPLRVYFHEKKCISKIIDFKHKKVFKAQTYTAITFLNKRSNHSLLYDRIDDDLNPEEFLKEVNGSLIELNGLDVKKWRLLKTNEQKNIKVIESLGKPIGQLFELCVGIATLKDKVFFIDGNEEENDFFLKRSTKGLFKIEKEATKSVFKISDFKSQKDIKRNKRKIIFPYRLKSNEAKIIPEEEFKALYPETYKYLLSEKEELDSRDKGKGNFVPFYQWGRSQGLTRTGKRIVNPTFSKKPRFLIVEEEDSYFTNGYGLFFKNPIDQDTLFIEEIHLINRIENIDVVQKILNSSVMDYYVKTTSVSIQGGYPCYQKNFIEKFTIPELSQDEIDLLRSISNPEEINNFLIEKYQLNLPVPNLLS